MKKIYSRKINIFIVTFLLVFSIFIITPKEKVSAGSYDGRDLALAILANQSTLLSSQYSDTDNSQCRQGAVLSSLGTMLPTDGSNFTLLSTGIAGTSIITTNALNPGDERGEWFAGGKFGNPRDRATLTLELQVPQYMHYLYYDVQFFTAEYPDYVGSQYNDKFTVTVDSPSQGVSEYIIDVNSGDFVLNSNDIPGTGFNIFATSGRPGGVDWVSTTPHNPGADAGATALVRREHPVSPLEIVTVTFDIRDAGDNLFDSGAFIDKVMFDGFAKTEIIARKTAQDLNGEPLECGDNIKYTITISNTGTADQTDNPGNEFEDYIPENTTYMPGSVTATSGTIDYVSGENKITWNGGIPDQSSVALTFNVTVNQSLFNGSIVSNQGTVYWDSNENGTNDATELTDDPSVNDLIDQDGDGETDDDDPTILIISSYEPPSIVTEDFSDDSPGGKATQSYESNKWFETSEISVKSNFEVASSYHYSTAHSFKTKLRATDSPQYWIYNLSDLNSDMIWWEIWFACGDTSEQSDIYLDFKNTNGNNIAQLKFEYTQMGSNPPINYVLDLYYWQPGSGWTRLNTDYINNGWYKLRIEKSGSSNINYSLYIADEARYDNQTGNQLSSPFSNFKQIEWKNTKNPIVCPMLFWDEHRLGLIN